MPLTWLQDAKGTIGVIFINICHHAGAPCEALLVGVENGHLKPRKEKQSALHLAASCSVLSPRMFGHIIAVGDKPVGRVR